MVQIVIYLLMAQRFINLKQKTLDHSCSYILGNISRDFTVDNMKKTGLNEYVYDFGVDYNAIANEPLQKKP